MSKKKDYRYYMSILWMGSGQFLYGQRIKGLLLMLTQVGYLSYLWLRGGKDFINFLRSYDFVISDNEIKVLLEQISSLNISTVAHIDRERVLQQVNPKKYLIENGYKELGDLFQSNKGIDDFYKEKGYDPESTL